MSCPDYARVDRVLALARLLRTNKPFNAETLAGELNMTARTVKRDIAYLRSRGWVIEWRAVEHEYALRRAPKPVL